MNVEKKYSSETYPVSLDIIMDIVKIILQADLKYVITEVKENKSRIVFVISWQSDLKYQVEAVKNIKTILDQYEEYRFSENEEVNWKDN